MNQIILILLFRFATVPLDRATWPVSYEFYSGAEELEYAVQYVWENPRTLAIKYHPAEGGERRSVLSLDGEFRIVSDSIYGENGALAYLRRYEYADGKLRTQTFASQTARFFYAGDNLDSVAVVKNDSLIEHYKYTYDSQNRLAQSDHFYSKGGGPKLDHNRGVVAYFLPDSIVIRHAFIPDDRDSVRKTIYLKDNLPVKMSETEYFSGSTHRSTHLWKFAGTASIHPEKRKALRAIRNPGLGFRDFNVLGRTFGHAR